MTDNYQKIVQANLARLYANLSAELAADLPGEQDGNNFCFDAFGGNCLLSPEGIYLNGEQCAPILGILISLYALNACSEVCVPTPLKAFKEFPDSMPYVGAFTSHTEQVLVPEVERISRCVSDITTELQGGAAPEGTAGDFAFLVSPLPKIALCYIFYEADEDFSASVTCLFSNNAHQFMPMDGLADVGEYTSRKILEIIGP